nr:protein SCAR2-like [Tanacetum cinerariifolium]
MRRPNGIRPMKIQRPRTPLTDAVAAHDKNKLWKVSELAMPPIQKEEDIGTLLEQIRLKKANAIRQAAARIDDDSENNDSLSDS